MEIVRSIGIGFEVVGMCGGEYEESRDKDRMDIWKDMEEFLSV